MKLVFINYTNEPFSPTAAGAAISMWLWEMCQAAQKAGVEPLVIAKASPAEPYPWHRISFVPFPAPPQNTVVDFALRAQRKLTGWRYLRQRTYVCRVARAIRDANMEDAFLVLHNDPEMAIYLRRVLPKARIMLLFHNPDHYMRKTFRGDISKSTNVLMAVSNAAARAVEGAYGLRPNIMRTLYNGVDVDHFKPGRRDPNPVPIINYAGRIRSDKAPDILLRAALILSESTTSFSIQLLGTSQLPEGAVDAYELEIRDLIARLEQRGVLVRRAGYVDRNRLAEEFRKADIHVTPSRCQEAFGLAALEAMSTGLATIVSRTGGSPEVVGDAGFLFDPNSPAELAAHLKQLVVNENLRVSYGRKARSRAEQLTWDRTWGNLVELSGMPPR